jgi:hypothetical protein
VTLQYPNPFRDFVASGSREQWNISNLISELASAKSRPAHLFGPEKEPLHVPEHEDNEMMRPYEVADKA